MTGCRLEGTFEDLDSCSDDFSGAFLMWKFAQLQTYDLCIFLYISYASIKMK